MLRSTAESTHYFKLYAVISIGVHGDTDCVARQSEALFTRLHWKWHYANEVKTTSETMRGNPTKGVEKWPPPFSSVYLYIADSRLR